MRGWMGGLRRWLSDRRDTLPPSLLACCAAAAIGAGCAKSSAAAGGTWLALLWLVDGALAIWVAAGSAYARFGAASAARLAAGMWAAFLLAFLIALA